MAAYYSPAGNEQQADSNGAPVSGALINTYLAGTTTAVTTYADSAGLVPQANPIVCNSAGYPASPIFLPAGVAVKMVFTTSVASGSVAYRPPVDNITGVNDPSFATTVSEWTAFSGTPTYISATSFSLVGDQTSTFQINRRIRSTNTGGTIYSTVSASSFGAGITTVTVVNASGTLDAGLSAVSYALLSPGNPSFPAYLAGYESGALVNGTISATANAGALTIALKTAAGNDPSAADPVYVAFRSATAATGTPSILTVTTATSLVIPSTATLGVSANNTAFRLWVNCFNDAGTFRLGAVNCLSGTSVMALRDDILASSTTVAGASNSAQVIYTGTGVTSKAMRILGSLEWSTGLAAIGTWTAQTKTQQFGRGVTLPGEVVQVQRTDLGSLASGTTIIPYDNTPPQNTEGTQFLSRAITPSSAANLLVCRVDAQHSTTVVVRVIGALYVDSGANAVAAKAYEAAGAAGNIDALTISNARLAGGVAAVTFAYRAGPSSAATLYINGDAAGVQLFGGVSNSYIEAQEVMA